MTSVFANNAYSTLAASITTSTTAIVLSAGEGARFPAPTGSDYFYVTFIDTANNLEVAKCTSRATDTLTVVRAQEGTTATAYAVGDRVEQRITAAGLTDVITASEAAASDAVTGTSTTSVAIATGAKSFTTQTGKFFAVGQWLLITSDADGTNYMHGQSTAYDTTTGVLTVNVTDIGGSGTLTDWTIRLSGTRGAVGATGLTGQPQWQGQWLTATNYAVNDSVYENGSSYICLISHTSGTFAADLGNLDWELMAEKGTGDVVGPAGATQYALAVFADTTGKALQDGPALGNAGDVMTSNGAGALPSMQAAGGGGGQQSVQVFTASGTWAKPAGLAYAEITCIGGGGGGQGSSTTAVSGGGGAGGCAVKFIAASLLGATETVTIGAGGAGGGASSWGAAGGTSSFGTICSATGGLTEGGLEHGSGGGIGTGGDVNILGEAGGSINNVGISGNSGGGSFFAGGGKGASGTLAAQAGVLGGGGGGGGYDSTPAVLASGAGGSGVIVVKEFY